MKSIIDLQAAKVFQFKGQLFVAFFLVFGIAIIGILRNSSTLPGLDRLIQLKGSFRSALATSALVDGTTITASPNRFGTPPQNPPTFKVKADSILPSIQEVIKRSRKINDEVASQSAPRNFDSVVAALAYDEMQLNEVSRFSLLKNVSPEKGVRVAATDACQQLMDYLVEAVMRPDVYQAIKAVYDEKPILDAEDERLLVKMELGYRRAGLLLPSGSQQKVKDLQQKMTNISSVFAQNLGEEKGGIWFSKDDLDGVPADLVETWDTRYLNNTKEYKMTYKYPDIFPTLKYANQETTRRKAWVGYESKVPENVGLMVEMMKLRKDVAKILGYDTFADYAIEEKMAKTGIIATEFLGELAQKLRPAGQDNLKILKRIKKEQGTLAPLKGWDHSWASRILVEQEYDVDAEKVAEYFEMDNTVLEMLNVYETLFSLKFVELSRDDVHYDTWHVDVRQFAVWRSDSLAFSGWLYFDMFPREGKFGHAAEFVISPGGLDEAGVRQYPVVALVCNFSKPTKDKPSLLKHEEVVTFFHELGHGIHDLVSQVKWSRFHGTSVVPVSVLNCR